MPDTIRTILEELYQLEPQLKKYEAGLAPIIFKLVKANPHIRPSAKFVADLKIKLLNKEKELMSNHSEHTSVSPWFKIALFIRQPYLLTVVAVVAFALILVSYLPATLRRVSGPQQFQTDITYLPAGAFGSLVATAVDSMPPSSLGAPEASQSPGSPSTNALIPDAAVSTPAVPAPVDKGGGAMRPLIYPYPSYNYIYVGEAVTNLPSSVAVLKRVKNQGLPVGMDFLRSFEVGDFKLSSFAAANLSQLTLVEDKDFGYTVNIDLIEGMINIFENWRRWPQPYNDCRDEACYEQLRLKPEQMPSDAELIALANQWLEEHGFDPSLYDQPYIQNEWRLAYLQATDKSQMYVPDVITVIYPVRINQSAVYEQGGQMMGLGVNINVRFGRVSGLWNMLSQKYQASTYEAETDFAKLVKLATSGYAGYPQPLALPEQDVKQPQVDLQLGTPTSGYLRYWHYQGNDSQELYLPALVFPVLNPPAGGIYYGPKQVVVPLVKEFLQSIEQGGGPIRIMPAAGQSSSGAASSEPTEIPIALPPADN